MTGKRYLTTEAAVQAGYFNSQRQAAERRHRRLPPRFYKPSGPTGPALYSVDDLEAWVQSGEVPTVDTLPRRQRFGTGDD